MAIREAHAFCPTCGLYCGNITLDPEWFPPDPAAECPGCGAVLYTDGQWRPA